MRKMSPFPFVPASAELVKKKSQSLTDGWLDKSFNLVLTCIITDLIQEGFCHDPHLVASSLPASHLPFKLFTIFGGKCNMQNLWLWENADN